MTNLLIFPGEIQNAATAIRTNGVFHAIRNEHSFRSAERKHIGALNALSADSLYTEYDGGSSTYDADFLSLARADVMQSSVVGVVLQGSSASFFTPTILSAAVAFDPNRGVTSSGGLVSAVTNYQGSTGSLSASGTARPTYVAPSGGINSHACLQFDGTTDAMATADYNLPTNNFTLAIVIRPQKVTGSQTIFGTDNDRFSLYLNGSTLTVTFYDGGSFITLTKAGIVLGTTYVVTIVKSSTAGFQMWVDGVSAGSNASNTAITFTSDKLLRVGAQFISPTYGQFAQVDLGELVVYPTALGTTDRQTVEAYLATKYKTTPIVSQFSFNSATLYGPQLFDWFSKFTASSAFRYWVLTLHPNGTSKYPHSKHFFGTAFDPGVDPEEIPFTLVETNESKYQAPSGQIHAMRPDRNRYQFSINWVGITSAKVLEFETNIAQHAARRTFHLYTDAQHTVLDGRRIVHCRLKSWSSSPNSIEKTNLHDLKAVFEELP